MNRLLRPSVVIPATLSIALLAALVAVSNPAQLVAVMEGFQHIYLLYVLLLMVAYEAVRCAQWHFLLTALDIRVPLRMQVLAFLCGEVTESLPVGAYFRNYLLHRSGGIDFALSSTATTLSIVTEVAICLGGLVIIGLGDWSGWLRPVIVIGLALFLFLVWAVHRSGYSLAVPAWLRERAGFRRVADELRRFRAGVTALVQPRVLAIESLLGALYLIVAGAGLYLVVRGLGIGHVSFWQALAVYLFGLAFALISPVPLDIGVLEVSGVGALVASGVSETDAAGVMLLNRVLRIGAAMAIALIAVVVWRGELRAAFQEL